MLARSLLSDGWSLPAVSAELAERGFTGVGGRPLSADQISRLVEQDPATLMPERPVSTACAICGRADPSHWDHDHQTGVWRELLCRGCNIGLGHFGDDPARLRAAADYLERHAPAPRQEIAPPPDRLAHALNWREE